MAINKLSKMSLERKNTFKRLCEGLNAAGYFINKCEDSPVVYVMSQNNQHDTLLGVWNVINLQSIKLVTVGRCPDDRVVQVVVEKE